MINITVDSGDIIASLALIFSVYATFKTVQFNNRQQEVIKSQAKLNELLLEKETAGVELEKQADLGVAFLKLGSNKYRLKVYNKGKAPARQVTIAFPEGNEVIPESDLQSKFPLQLLDVHQSVELIAAVHLGTAASRSKCNSQLKNRSVLITKLNEIPPPKHRDRLASERTEPSRLSTIFFAKDPPKISSSVAETAAIHTPPGIA